MAAVPEVTAPPAAIFVDEKYDIETPATASTVDAYEADWTPAEESALRRKLDLIIMPLVWIGFFVFQLERGNISNAITDGFLTSVGITTNQLNTGNGVLYLGIVLLEIPSNYFLMKFSAQKWITAQIFAFGLVATFQAFQKNYAGYLVTRILLGVTECGFIPGSLYVMSTFYKRSELALRNSIFFTASATATACTGLFAYGILPLGGADGLKSWQWLFIIEGCMAIFVSLVWLLLMPHSPAKPTTILGWTYFNERERHIILGRVLADDAQKTNQNRALTKGDILSTVGNYRVWLHVLITIPAIAVTAAIGTYTPTLIKSFGFSTLRANAMSSAGGWCQLLVIPAFAVFSDKTNLRGYTVIASLSCITIVWIAFHSIAQGTDKYAKYTLIVLIGAFGQAWHPLDVTWLSLNQFTPQQRSVSMAMIIMAANTGAAVGSQIMRTGDAPKYPKGFTASVVLVSLSLIFAIGTHVQYRISNKRIDRGELSQKEGLVKRFVQ